jgi:hypothetical protein|tara:strand:+ start:183 stop:383 length:201 start_codon:yes stop_codon:yes gene_type:complete
MQKIRLDSSDSDEFLLSRTPSTEQEKAVMRRDTKKSNNISNAYSASHLTPKQKERRRQYKIRKGDV